MSPPPRRILPTIVGAQFCGTSVWFATNAVAEPLAREFSLSAEVAASLTSMVQLGFVVGTLLFALGSLADRVPARLLFLICASLGALATFSIPWAAQSGAILLSLRFLTGFFLAGVYPVGMKIAAAWFGRGLGKSLGYLVGALVVGTAFPHAVHAWVGDLDVRWVFWTVSGLSLLGGVGLYVLVPEGPLAQPGARFDPGALRMIFSYPRFRAAALGYFGHMWELYAFWATVPWVVQRSGVAGIAGLNVPIASFLVIGTGALGCAVAGERSLVRGAPRVAASNLRASGLCCLGSPLLFFLPPALSLAYLLVWGWTVVADSAQFSSIAAAGAPPQYVGSALTWMSCIGFALTIGSVEMMGALTRVSGTPWVLLALSPGPIFGLWAMRSLFSEQTVDESLGHN